MLNPFPQFLVFGFFAPTLLRVAAAIIFAYLAYRHFQNRNEISLMRFPVVGQGAWITWFAIIAEAALAAALFFGYYTQIAVIVGVVASLKHIVWRNKYPHFFVLVRSTAFLLIILLLSLILTGAGAFAFDLPL